MAGRLLLLLTVILSTGLRSAIATTIVVVKTQSEIVVGADSMVGFIDEVRPPIYTFCKIMPVHDFFIAVAGIYQPGSGRLNIEQVVASATEKGDSLSQAVERSVRRISSALGGAVRDARENQGLYKELLRGNVQTFFFGFESEKPAVYDARFYMTADRAAKEGKPAMQVIETDRNDCGPDCLPSDEPYIAHTPSREMAAFWAQNRDSLSKEEPIQIVRDLISSDIEANKDRSGPPIDILHIDAQGPRWIARKPNC